MNHRSTKCRLTLHQAPSGASHVGQYKLGDINLPIYIAYIYLQTLQLLSDIIQGVPALVRPQALVESNANGAYAHICSLKGIIKVLNVSLEKHHHTTNYDHCQRMAVDRRTLRAFTTASTRMLAAATDFTSSCGGLQPP